MRPLLELPRWVHAATVLGETGSARPISEILAGLGDDQSASQVSNALRRVSESYLSGLPLELGRAVHDAVTQRRVLGRLLRDRHRLPRAYELVARISETLRPYELSSVSGNWKGGVVLTREELSRHARLVGDLWQRGSHAVSVGLMREWMVSWAQWRLGTTDGWLKEPSRRAQDIPVASPAGAATSQSPEVEE